MLALFIKLSGKKLPIFANLAFYTNLSKIKYNLTLKDIELKKIFYIVATSYAFTLSAQNQETFKIGTDAMLPNFKKDEIVHSLSVDIKDIKRGSVIFYKAKSLDNKKEFKDIKRVIAVPKDKIKIHDSEIYVNNIKLARKSKIEIPKDLKKGEYGKYQFLIFEETIDGVTFEVAYEKECFSSEVISRMDEKLLDDNEFFVMGDNRCFSVDSRIKDPVKFNDVIGKI